MSKHNSETREEAYAHQFIQDAEMLLKMAQIKDPTAFKSALESLERHIESYKGLTL